MLRLDSRSVVDRLSGAELLLRDERHNLMSRLPLPFPCGIADRLQIEIVLSGQGLPNTPHLFYDRVFDDSIFVHGCSPSNAYGVQITGHSKPCLSQACSTLRAMAALA